MVQGKNNIATPCLVESNYVNLMWHADGDDNLKPFSLAISESSNGFSRFSGFSVDPKTISI